MINNFKKLEVLIRNILKLEDSVQISMDSDLNMLGLTSFERMALAIEIRDTFNISIERLLPRHFLTPRTLCITIERLKNISDSNECISSSSLLEVSTLGRDHILSRIIDRAKSRPMDCCIVDAYGVWNYKDIIDIAMRVSNKILRLYPDKPCRIALIGDRDHYLFAAYLGILLAGGTVVPLSLESPLSRNKNIIKLADVRLVLSTLSLEENRLYNEDVPVLSVSDLNEKYFMDRTPVHSEGAYLIFTSGSTGIPKGVPITYENINAFIDATTMSADFTSSDIFLQGHELSFDLSVPEFWIPWIIGATVHVCTRMELLDLVNTVNRYGITVLTITPALLALILTKGGLPSGSMLSLKRIMICGESLPVNTLRILRESAPYARIDNYYGPTEVTVWCTQFSVPPLSKQHNFPGMDEVICPIGIPLSGFETINRGEIDKDANDDNYYELLVRGPQVFRGYLGEKDDGKFIDKNFKTWYCTGDIVKNDPRGYMCFLGRIDSQVKISGYRVDLGEVERAVISVVNRPAGACLVQNNDGFVIATAVVADKINPDDIRAALAEIIPRYMIPSILCTVTELPLTINNKLDRGKLARKVFSRYLET